MPKTAQRELFNYPKSKEVENIVKSNKEREDLGLDHFATLPAIKGSQFGREIFSTMIKFKDLLDFLEVFPEVQRNIQNRKVIKIKNYVLSGLYDRSALRFFSSLTVTCRGGMFYDESTHKVAINTKDSKLSVNDGQHRFYGISEAIRELQGKYNSESDPEKKDHMILALNELKNMVIPLVIYNHIDEVSEKQLFHDLNNLASRPSRSATIKLAQTDLFSKMAREIATENRYLRHYGVEMDKMSIHGDKNENTILLTTVYTMIKLLFGKSGKSATTVSNFFREENYSIYKKKATKMLDNIFSSLPHDLNDKQKYILVKSFALKGVARFYYEAIEEYHAKEETVMKVIKNTDFSNNFDHWKKYGASLSSHGNIIFTNYLGIMAIHKTLMENLQKESGDLFSSIEENE